MNFKKATALGMAAVMTMSLAACGSSETPANTDAKTDAAKTETATETSTSAAETADTVAADAGVPYEDLVAEWTQLWNDAQESLGIEVLY